MKKQRRRKDVEKVLRISARAIPGHRKTGDAEQEHFAKTLDHLKTIVLEGKEHVAIAYGVTSAAKANPDLAEIARTFWAMTIHAHIDRAQMLAAKLFDTQINAMTIERLLAQAEQHVNAFKKPDEVQAIISVAREQIQGLNPRLKGLREKRSRILAHSDPTIITDPVRLEKAAKVSFNDLHKIFSVAEDILKLVFNAFCGVGPSLTMIPGAGDYRKLIELVETHAPEVT